MKTLLQLLREMSPFERGHISSIQIKTGARGYAVVASINLYLPLGADPTGMPDSVTVYGCERYPNVELTATWEIPIWAQIMEVIKDPAMRLTENLGTFVAAEHSKHELDGKVSQREAMKIWVISTHGKPRSPERMAWIAQCMEMACPIRKVA